MSVSLSTEGLRLRSTPSGPLRLLERGTKYKAVVTTGAKDVAGNPLDQITTTTGLQQKAWSFTVN